MMKMLTLDSADLASLWASGDPKQALAQAIDAQPDLDAPAQDSAQHEGDAD